MKTLHGPRPRAISESQRTGSVPTLHNCRYVFGVQHAWRVGGIKSQCRPPQHRHLATLPASKAAVQEDQALGTPLEDDDLQRIQSASAAQFAALGVDAALLPGLQRMGVVVPTPIQAAGIPPVLAGSNVAVQSYTGSGKTLAYLLPVLSQVLARGAQMYKANGGKEVPVQAVVVAPSQELAMQVVRVAQGLLPPQGRTLVQQCIGGANPKNQQIALQRNKPLVVVGTPGRLAEFMRLGSLRVHDTPILVLDEADQLLAPQFAEDMAAVTEHVGKRLSRQARRTGDALADKADMPVPAAPAPSRQTVLVSATLSRTVLAQMAAWCPAPEYVSAGGPAPMVVHEDDVARGGSTGPDAGAPGWGWGVKGWDGPASSLGPKGTGSAGGVEGDGLVPSMPPHLKHYMLVASGGRKVDCLRRALHTLGAQRALVFMNWQQRLKDVKFKLEARGLAVEVLHGEMPKLARQTVLRDFQKGKLRALIVSDVVARGLDVVACDAVFHLELPSSAAHYAHRAGRTGRMGAPGSVVSIVSPGDVWVVDKLAAKLGVEIQEVHLAHGALNAGPTPPRRATDDGNDSGGEDGGAAAPGLTARQPAPAASKRASLNPAKPSAQPATTRIAAPSPAADAKAAGRNAGPAKGAEAGVPKGARTVADASGRYGMIIYDEDDEVEMEEEAERKLDAQVEELRGAGSSSKGTGTRRPQAAKGGHASGSVRKAGPKPAEPWARAVRQEQQQPAGGGEQSVKHAMSEELAALKAEKAALSKQRYERRQVDRQQG